MRADSKRTTDHMLMQSRPCPWCDHHDMVLGHGQVAGKNVVCVNCGARGPTGSNAIDAIKRWNARRWEEKR